MLVADAAGEKLLAATFAHDEKGLRALRRQLVRLKVRLVAIERPDGLLVERLLDAGLRVLALHPNQVAAAGDRFRVSGGKSDRFDASHSHDFFNDLTAEDARSESPQCTSCVERRRISGTPRHLGVNRAPGRVDRRPGGWPSSPGRGIDEQDSRRAARLPRGCAPPGFVRLSSGFLVVLAVPRSLRDCGGAGGCERSSPAGHGWPAEWARKEAFKLCATFDVERIVKNPTDSRTIAALDRSSHPQTERRAAFRARRTRRQCFEVGSLPIWGPKFHCASTFDLPSGATPQDGGGFARDSHTGFQFSRGREWSRLALVTAGGSFHSLRCDPTRSCTRSAPAQT